MTAPPDAFVKYWEQMDPDTKYYKVEMEWYEGDGPAWRAAIQVARGALRNHPVHRCEIDPDEELARLEGK